MELCMHRYNAKASVVVFGLHVGQAVGYILQDLPLFADLQEARRFATITLPLTTDAELTVSL